MSTEEITRIHEGLGHLHGEGLFQSLRRSGYTFSRQEVTRALSTCTLCPLFNHSEKKIPRRQPGSRAYGSRFGEELEHDLTFLPTCGRLTRTKILSTIRDRYTGTVSLLPIAKKGGAYEHVETWDRLHGHTTGSSMNTVNGGEFVGHTYTSTLKRLRMRHRRGPAYTPQRQGIIERLNKEVKRLLRKLLRRMRLPPSFWDVLLPGVREILDKRVHQRLGMSPYEKRTGKAPNYSDVLPGDVVIIKATMPSESSLTNAPVQPAYYLGTSNDAQ